MLRGKLFSLQDKLQTVEKQFEKAVKPKKEKKVEKKEKKSKKKRNQKGMSKIKTVAGITLVAFLMVGGIALADTIINNFNGPATITQNAGSDDRDDRDEIIVGGFPGTDVYQHVNFHGGISNGGTIWATTTDDAITLTQGDIDDEVSYLQILPYENLTITTMATGSMGNILSSIPGSKREYILHNASTTAASTITIAAGTGVDLQEDEGETVVINGLEFARLTFIRTGLGIPGGANLSGGDGVTLIVEVFQVGD